MGDNGRLGASHAYPPPITMIAGGMGEPLWVAAPSHEQMRVKRRAALAVASVANNFRVAKADQLITAGDPAVELPALAKHWEANLLVMGAVSRSGIKRVFIGNTAERIIDAVHCDVLVVKPRSFKSPVGRKPHPLLLPVPSI